MNRSRRLPARRAAAAGLALLVALAPATAADAGHTAATTTAPLQPIPEGLNVSVLRPTAVNINWVLRNAPPGARMHSTVGLFKETNSGSATAGCATGVTATGGATMGQLNSTVTGVIGRNGVARVVETLIIPGTVAERALKRGLAAFFYCRVFRDPGGAVLDPATSSLTVANAVTCNQGSSAYANFSISRAELFFDDRRRIATVPMGTPDLKVNADVAYNGSGLMRAVWEVAELGAPGALGAGPINAPPSVFTTGVDPNLLPPRGAFRILHTITQYVSFGDRMLLTLPPSVPLPTNQPGTFLVNLRFIEPPVGFEIPVATYFVKPTEIAIRHSAINPLAPADAQMLPYGVFGFRWESIPGVSQYRLDVFPSEAVRAPGFSGLIAGPASNPSSDSNVFNRTPGLERDATVSALVPSGMTSFNLRQGHLTRLVAGRSYGWQVKGLDQHGNVVGQSPVRQFTLAPR